MSYFKFDLNKDVTLPARILVTGITVDGEEVEETFTLSHSNEELDSKYNYKRYKWSVIK